MRRFMLMKVLALQQLLSVTTKEGLLRHNAPIVPFAADSSTTEAMKMIDGLILANSLGCNIVEDESDSMEVINFCSGSSQWWDSAAASYADCLDTANLIGKVKFKHCLCTPNTAAHELAKFSFCNNCSET